MDNNEFWRRIELAKEEAGGAKDMESAQQQAEFLTGKLATLPPDEIIAFENLFRQKMRQAYRWDLWGAAYVINGGCSDDGFEYFRAWLIGQGRKVFEAALANPDSLARIVSEEIECEDLLHCAFRAHQQRTDHPIPQSRLDWRALTDPVGQRWDDADLEDRLPKLTRRFG